LPARPSIVRHWQEASNGRRRPCRNRTRRSPRSSGRQAEGASCAEATGQALSFAQTMLLRRVLKTNRDRLGVVFQDLNNALFSERGAASSARYRRPARTPERSLQPSVQLSPRHAARSVLALPTRMRPCQVLLKRGTSAKPARQTVSARIQFLGAPDGAVTSVLAYRYPLSYLDETKGGHRFFEPHHTRHLWSASVFCRLVTVSRKAAP